MSKLMSIRETGPIAHKGRLSRRDKYGYRHAVLVLSCPKKFAGETVNVFVNVPVALSTARQFREYRALKTGQTVTEDKTVTSAPVQSTSLHFGPRD